MPDHRSVGPTVGLIVALPGEARAAVRGIARSGADEARFAVRVAGVGAAGAAATATDLLGAGVSLLVSAGVAGGLRAGLRPGTVVIPDLILDEASEVETPAALNAALRAALAGPLPLECGRLYSSARVLGRRADKEVVARRSHCVAVDMESAAIGRAGLRAGRPMAVIRVIADALEDPIPQPLLDLAAEHGRLDRATLLRRAWFRPGVLVRAAMLRRRYRLACAVLAQALAATAPVLQAGARDNAARDCGQ